MMRDNSLPKEKLAECKCASHFDSEVAMRRVHVVHPNHDWGYFLYCDDAIEQDRSRGFRVEIVDEQ
jgi:hypothetical protein